MYNGGSAEFVVEQGLYYPTAANYGYYSTGFESPGEWDDHQRFFGLDGLDVQYTGAQTETLPYVYYTPSYGYAESPYNPYNPYIPGAVIGVDDPFAGAQQYYTIPPYQTTVSSPAYFPAATHSRADAVSAGSQDFFPDASASAYNIAFCPSLKHSPPPSAIVYMPPQGPASNPTHSLILPEGPRANAGPSKQIVTHGNLSSGSFRNPASSHVHQGIGASGSGQALDNVPNGRVPSHCNQLKVALPFSRGLSDFSSSAHQQPHADKVQPNLHYGSASGDVNGSMDVLNEQNRGPRTNKSKKLLSVKSCTPNTVDDNTQGNFISADQYNKDDFLISYVDAKFFVIKSYSEDDVHKSVKYNVWSSTPNGNKKLNAAYEDSQRIGAEQSRCCPVFLFFSVNASGQFCGVAEMIGPVDFQKDMNFWQQDKWSGNFPVKWHFIKDVPNTNFRHIVLENNENKPVTNSRDTQEIKYKQGIEMLKIFKTYTLKTSLLDDFLYYENRQKFIQEEKARLLFKSYGNPFFVSPVDPPRQRSAGVNHPPNEDDNFYHQDKPDKPLKPSSPTSTCKEPDNGHVEMTSKGDSGDTPEQNESSPPSGGEEDDVVRVGSVAVKVNGFAKSKNVVTVGTIVLDPGSLVGDKGRVCLEGGKGG